MPLSMTQSDAKAFVPQQAMPQPAVSENPSIKVISHANPTPFRERSELNLDSFEYERRAPDPGRIIIFNQETFNSVLLGPRIGSRRDVNEIILCFQRLGFNVFENDVSTDLTRKEVMAKIDEVAQDKKSLKDTNCLIIIFLTHGGTNNELYVKDDVIRCSDVWTKFHRCPFLENKPKMFIFQACKGDYHATIDGKTTDEDANLDPSKLLNVDSFIVNKLGNDMLILFSTLEGNISFRDPDAGTWFIQELCKNFTAYGRRDDVVSLVTRTLKCVCGNYFYHYEDDGESRDVQKQMPIFVSTLSKKFYLNRNKDRHLLLDISRKQDEMLQLLRTIASNVKK